MSALIFTIAQNGYGTAFLQCIASQREYSRTLGAEFVVVNRPSRVHDTALSAWLKIPLMLQALESGYDWVAYIDADCEVRVGAPDFRESLEPVSGDVFMAHGRSGRVNSGVMFAKNSHGSRQFFSRVLESITTSIPAEDRASLKYENGNVIHVERVHGGVTVMDQAWNNTYEPELADHVRHYTGVLRPLLRRPFFREVQYQVLRRLGSRQLRKFQSQPARREVAFAEQLSSLALESVRALPGLRLEAKARS